MVVEIVEGERAILEVNVGHSVVTNVILCVRGGDELYPNYFEENSFHFRVARWSGIMETSYERTTSTKTYSVAHQVAPHNIIITRTGPGAGGSQKESGRSVTRSVKVRSRSRLLAACNFCSVNFTSRVISHLSP